ncbi:tRNA (adenosine(37)-N6)-dimethylallyltransferase MiaA [Barrientosiimonas marina]|uniref:tRNA dimethylallyltransferase n=1 Tax=Lentibacillus kimchii TaxID=1542911 RepID=A0ABW2UUV0_9BACI
MIQPVVAIVGPTGVGKTRLSIDIAHRFDGEVINGDSLQVYRGLNIGTDKITQNDKQSIPHHMLDIKHPSEPFSAADFQQMVQASIEAINRRGKLPVIVGGTGLYIQAALYNYHFAEKPRDENVTRRLEEELKTLGADKLYENLKAIDPDQAVKIHPNNHQRLIRALEIYETTGKTMSDYQQDQPENSPYSPILLGLEMDRQLLYQRINARVEQMLEQGLVEEVRLLYNQGYENHQALRGIGYKEFIPYFKGEQTFDDTIKLLKRNSRRYAKRQYTWFKNKMQVNWYHVTPDAIDGTFEKIFDDLAGMLARI